MEGYRDLTKTVKLVAKSLLPGTDTEKPWGNLLKE